MVLGQRFICWDSLRLLDYDMWWVGQSVSASFRFRWLLVFEFGHFALLDCRHLHSFCAQLLMIGISLVALSSVVAADIFLSASFPPQASCGGLPCIPGFDKFTVGFDATIGDLPQQPLPLLNYSFAAKATYTNPFDKSVVYGVNDQINVIDDTHAEQSVSSSTFHSTTSYTDYISTSSHLSTGFGWFSASASASYSRNVLKDNDDYGAFSTSSLRVNLYDMVVVPSNYMLSAEARNFLAQLPDDCRVDDYLPFINRYGTHYVAAAKLGGSGRMTSAINKHFASSSDDTKVSAQASVHFSHLQAGGSAQGQVEDASSDFTIGMRRKSDPLLS